MTRRAIATVAACLLLLVAGCQTTNPAATPTSETPTEAATTETLTPPTTTHATTTARESFNATLRFVDCTTAVVNASSYYWVGIITADGAIEHSGDYNGTTTFETDAAIREVIVAGERGEKAVVNPGFGACTAAETTTTTTTTTMVTPTPTETATATPEPTTTTTTRTPTPTPTTTERPREELHEYKISTHVENKTLGRDASLVAVVTNYHDRATVAFDYDVGFYTDLKSGGYLMETINRTHLVLGPGESATVRVSFGENASIDKVDWRISNLDYAEEEDTNE